MISRILSLIAVAFVVTGCVTVPPPALSIGDLQGYRIVDVAVEKVEVIRSWPAEEETYVKLHPAETDTAARLQAESAANFPQVTRHFGGVLTERFKMEFASQVTPILSGTRPVRAIVRLKTFDVPSAGRRVFVDNTARMQAEIDLVDAKSGASVLRYDGPLRTRQLIGGLATGIALALDRSDPGYSLITDYMTAYRNWLLQK